jgi:transposase
MNQKHKPSLSRKDKEKRRLKAAKMFEKGLTQAEVVRKFKVTSAAACQWYEAWKKGGNDALKSKGHPGFESELTSEKKKAFRKAILKGPLAFGYETDLWTLSRLKTVMKKINKIDFSEGWIWKIVRDLGFTPQKPQVKAKQRDEKAIKQWKEKTLPDLKKMG